MAPKPNFCGRLVLAGLALVAFQRSAHAVDGVAVTIQYKYDPSVVGGDPLGRNIVRYDVEDDHVTGSEVIYDAGDAAAASLSPDGQHVAFVRDDKTLCVIPARGGQVTELARAARAAVQWPAGDGGRWVYFLEDDDASGRPRVLQRVNVDSRQLEFVVSLSTAPRSFALSQDATLTSGRLLAQPAAWRGVAGYDLSHGHGDLYQRVLLIGEGGEGVVTVSPDGAAFAAGGVRDHPFTVYDWNGGLKQSVRVNQWADAADGKERWRALRWSVNSDSWLVASQGPAGERREGEPTDRLNVVLYNLMDGEQVLLTDNPPLVYDVAQGFWDAAGQNFGLGYFAGEAPLTVRPAVDGAEGDWNRDFGDGTADEGGDGEHVYEHPGVYTVTARRGDEVREGHVTVNEQAAPSAVAADVLDARHVLVSFDEPVRLEEGAELVFSGGGGVKGWDLDPNGMDLVVELDEPVAEDGELTLQGVVDRAQAANPLADEPMPVEVPAWPRDREGLVYLWESADAPNVVLHPSGRRALFAHVLRLGVAKFDRHGAMRCAGGGFYSPDWPSDAVGGKSAPAVSVEAVVRADDVGPQEAVKDELLPLIGVGDGSGGRVLIGQQGGRLYYVFETGPGGPGSSSEPLDLCALPPGEPHHLLLVEAPSELRFYLDGEQVFERQGPWGLENVKFGRALTFAGRFVDDGVLGHWRGTIEGVAVYRRAVGPEEAAANAAHWREVIEKRGNIPQIEVDAKLLATSVTPRPEAIAPYRDALVVYEYEVLGVVRGEYGGEKIRVAHHGLVNAVPAPVSKARPGSEARLVLELFTDRPDLAETMTSDTLPEDFETPLYVEAD